MKNLKQILMYFATVVIASIFAVGCSDNEENLGIPRINISQGGEQISEVSLDKEGGNTIFELSSSRDWKVENVPEWIVVEPESGYAGENQKITLSTLNNDKVDRSVDIKFNIGYDYKLLTVKQKGEHSVDDVLLYYNNFDKEEAKKGDKGYPFLDQSDCWKNAEGNAAEAVAYDFKSMSARNNATSNGKFSDYSEQASGMNNLFFGAGSHFAVKNIALGESRNYKLSFGGQMFVFDDKEKKFDPESFHLYVSEDNKKWAELKYEFANGFQAGKWDLATILLTVPEASKSISICFKADKGSIYRLDDLKFELSTEAGVVVDYSKGIDMDLSGGDTPTPDPTPGDVKKVSIADFLAAKADNETWYQITGKVDDIWMDKNDKTKQNPYGNFDLVDEKDATVKVHIHGMTKTKQASNDKSFPELGLKEGDIITIVTLRQDHEKDGTVTPQGGGNTPAYFVSKGEGGGEVGPTPDPEPKPEGSVYYHQEFKTKEPVKKDGKYWPAFMDYVSKLEVPGEFETSGKFVSIRSVKEYGNNIWFAKGYENWIEFQNIDVKGAKEVTVTLKIAAHLFNAGEENDLAGLEVEVAGKTYKLPSTPVANKDQTPKELSVVVPATDGKFTFRVKSNKDVNKTGLRLYAVKVSGGEGGGSVDPTPEPTPDPDPVDPTPDPTPDPVDHSGDILYMSFGEGAPSKSPYPFLDQWLSDKAKVGMLGTSANTVEIISQGVSLRTSGKLSSGYKGASGKNHIWMASTSKGNSELEMSFIGVGANTSIVLELGASYFDYNSKSNEFKEEYLTISYKPSLGKEEFKKVKYSITKGSAEWVYIKTEPIAVAKESYVSFKLENTKGIRVDDLSITGTNEGDLVDPTPDPDPVDPTPDPEPTPDPDPTPGGIQKVTVAQFMNAAVSSDVWYELTGEVVDIWTDKYNPDEANPYGNFNIKDATGTIHIHGLTATKQDNNDKSFNTLGIKAGDILTLHTLRAEFNGSAQGGGNPPAYFVSKKEGEAPKPLPTPGPNVDVTKSLFYMSFGDQNPTSTKASWPEVSDWYSSDKASLGIQGTQKDVVKLTAMGATVRNTGKVSSGYTFASAGNHMWMAKGKVLPSIVSFTGIPTGDKETITLECGVNYYNFETKENEFKPEFLQIGSMEDGGFMPENVDYVYEKAGQYWYYIKATFKVEKNKNITIQLQNTEGLRIDDILINAE